MAKEIFYRENSYKVTPIIGVKIVLSRYDDGFDETIKEYDKKLKQSNELGKLLKKLDKADKRKKSDNKFKKGKVK